MSMEPGIATIGNRLSDSATETATGNDLGDGRDQSGAGFRTRIDNRGAERQIRRILVATDFSAGSTRAIERAVDLARQCNASLTLLHVIDINTNGKHSGAALELMRQLWGECFERMAQLAWSISGRVDAQTAVYEGLPWEEIATRSRDFDLLILGQNRRQPSFQLFSRHTTQRVLENAACPVMTVLANS